MKKLKAKANPCIIKTTIKNLMSHMTSVILSIRGAVASMRLMKYPFLV